ncbi:MAG: hypothetical protein KAR47_17690, partial [Planctomycetes bacterium]|nr:hypothetical protein [Planctomycetota bacterium]
HPDTGKVLTALGKLYIAEGKLTQARNVSRRAYDVLEGLFQPSHPDIAELDRQTEQIRMQLQLAYAPQAMTMQ